MRWRRLVGCGWAALVVSACEVQRPIGSYTPPNPDAGPNRVELPTPLDNDELPDLLGPDAGLDAGPDSNASPSLLALEQKVSGDYWMRVDLYNAADTGGITVNSHTTAFFLVRVGTDQDDGSFDWIDWQCVESAEQTCDAPCLSVSTAISPGESRAFRPPVRKLRVDPKTGKWSTSLIPFALGWEGNFVDDPDAGLPQDPRDPRVYDIAGDGKGVNVNVSIVTGDSTTKCDARVVQEIALAYSGTLHNGAFASGDVNEMGSDQTVFGGTCPPHVQGRKVAPYTLRMARVPRGKNIDEQWTCPSEAEFRAVLKAP